MKKMHSIESCFQFFFEMSLTTDRRFAFFRFALDMLHY